MYSGGRYSCTDQHELTQHRALTDRLEVADEVALSAEAPEQLVRRVSSFLGAQ